MILFTGKKRQFQVLYNSGAKINFIKYNLAKKHKLTPLQKQWKFITGFLDEHWIKLYNIYKFTVLMANMHNCTKVIGPQPFQVADFANYNFIFGYFWFVEADFKICFKTGIFEWWNNQELEGCISVINFKHMMNDVTLGKTIYILYLKEYWI